MEVPAALRRWFLVHFAIDVTLGLPLLLAPATLLGRLGWRCVDPAAARLVGAALLAIGTQSLLGRNDGAEGYRAMLNLKIVWSLCGVLALVVAIGEGAPDAVWAFMCVFIAFLGVWLHYRVRFRQLAGATADGDEDAS